MLVCGERSELTGGLCTDIGEGRPLPSYALHLHVYNPPCPITQSSAHGQMLQSVCRASGSSLYIREGALSLQYPDSDRPLPDWRETRVVQI